MNKLINKYKKMPAPIKASFWFAVCSFLQKGISLLTTPLFTRLLSTSDYGIVNVFSSWENIITIFATLNLASGVYLRGLIKYEDDKDEFSRSLESLLILNTGIVLIIYLVFQYYWNQLFELSTIYVVLMFVDILVIGAFHFWSARERVEYRYRKLIAFTIINAIAKPAVGFIAVTLSDDKAGARIVSMVAVDAAVFGYFLLKILFSFRKKINFHYWKYAIGYNLPLVPHYLSQIVLNQSDRIMIKKMIDDSSAGIYSLAYTAASILLLVNTAILDTFKPWIYKKIKSNELAIINRVSIYLLVFIAFINLLLIAFAPEILAILAPKAYYDARWIIPPVTMSVYFVFLYSLFSNFEFYYEKTKMIMVASVIGAGLNVLLNYIFINIYGYYAAGYTTLVCYFLFSLFHYIAMKYILKKNGIEKSVFNMKLIILITVSFVILGFALMFLYDYIIVKYSIVLAVLVLCIVFRKKLIHLFKSVKTSINN